MSLWAFQEKLDTLGHFYTRYQNIDQLKFHFSQQLDKLSANGFIEFKPEEGASAPAGHTTYQANLTGNGAMAQGTGATAVGSGGVTVGGNSSGEIKTGMHVNTGGGAYVAGDVNTGGDFVGCDKVAVVQGSVEAGGHFIGRDYIQILTQVVHEGEDVEEAKSVIAHYLFALMLLDGLDECGYSATRGRVFDAVQEVIRTVGPRCRFLLTARPYAWPDGPDPVQSVYALADLNDEQIKQFIRAWYAALETRNWLSPTEAKNNTIDLLQARHRPDLLPLVRNPLLLTLTATLHANRGRLPEDRADLYHESMDLLMLRWNRQIGADKALLDELAIPTLKLSDLREVLEELAFKVHEESSKEGKDADSAQAGVVETQNEVTADIGEDRLVRAFRPLLNDSRDKAAVVVDYIEKRAGLLIGQDEKAGERQFTFPHRTFQEFLAACFLAVQDDFPAECARLAKAAPGHWQVALPLAARLAKAERGAGAADELIRGTSIAEIRAQNQPGSGDWTCALLAGMQLQEIGVGAINKRERTRAIAAKVAGWITASLPLHPDEGGFSAVQRAVAGDVLTTLGDPRFDAQRFYLPADDMLGFVPIAADKAFRIGTSRAHVKRVAKITGYAVPDNESNDTTTPTPAFYIARYPVTVAQFRAFVEATQFEIDDPDALRDPENRPVRYISWHEALRYCDWLNQMLATAPTFEHSATAILVRESHWRVSLPSELEWEKAARGGLRDSIFPWGDTPNPNRANYRDSEIGDTSAVGCFPTNDYGLYDTVGNVWEWTRSLWGQDWNKTQFTYPYDLNEKKREDLSAGNNVLRVVRGGAFSSRRGSTRCACRYRSQPGRRIGFRVVLLSAPVNSAT